ncbi:MFS transporter [Stakelama tenebrarum]|uniref:YbfB/YjiJ family MFS transporter n=1 Tax=Stakelama tenebrarum TaxID=2711215 RepID=A0A6G6Y3J9_9SPHN|nr:MFS transporter [Sphingosinithalassobacter tenebrarum]QIG79387.1 YbfB/YjiJ family MFS transporter [Sphingosinithalassobacter tenebrarum]
MSPALRIGATSFALIAVCYGFARFAFGLFLPQIDRELGLGASLSGFISGGSFAGYCVTIIASALLTERFGARAVATAASLVAAIGMAGIALAPTPVLLAIAVMVAGSSTGLASPPLAAAVAEAVRRNRQDTTNTGINAGTSAGVALSGPIALAIAGEWRLAFAAYAAVALALAVAAMLALPGVRGDSRADGLFPLAGPVMRLICATFMMGAASTALWSFGGELVSQNLEWRTVGTGLLWTCIGAGGIAGGCAGMLVARCGLDRVHRAFLGLMAVGILTVGMDSGSAAVALVGGTVFGAAYIMLTGVYLVWGTGALPDRPATGLMVGFLVLAIGQSAGAPLFGLLMEEVGAAPAVAGFATIALLAGIFRAGSPATRRSQSQDSNDAGLPRAAGG